MTHDARGEADGEVILYPYHPRVVHFPIALGLVAAACLAWGLWRGRERWTGYGRTSLLFAWLGTLAAALTGLVDQSYAAQTQAVTDAINRHITAGVALIVVLGLALYWPLRDRRLFAAGGKRTAYVALLALGVALILLEGWLGGQLVYHLHVGVL
jgi:uncharacterized membrane protein